MERDQVTGLEQKAAAAGVLRERYDSMYDLGVLLIDIDFFEQYNDMFGTAQGNVALQHVSKALQREHHDQVYKYAGSAFLAIIENCNGQLLDWAEDTRAVITALRIPTSPLVRMPCHELLGLLDHVTVSIGGAKRRLYESVEHLLARADESLYLAKRKRDCARVEG
jgi:diguanylate cyclase (GGDEF)-like protein